MADAVNPFPPTPKNEPTDPRIALAKLKHDAHKAVRGNKVNLAIILGFVTAVGAFAAYLLSETKAQAQTQVAPVQVQVAAIDEKVNTHIGNSDKAHEKIEAQMKEFVSSQHVSDLKQVRMELMLERVSERVGASVPPPVRVDGGR